MKRYSLRAPSPKHEVWAVQRVWESGLKGNELLVAAILSMHGSPQGADMRPSIATISWWTSLSIPTVKRILRKFRTHKYLTVTHEADNVEHRATEYAWNFAALPPKPPLPKFLEEARKLKRASANRRLAKAGYQIDTPAGVQIDTPKKKVSGVSNRPFRGVTAVTPEVKEEVPGGVSLSLGANSGNETVAAAVCVEKQPPDTSTPELLEAAFTWAEGNPWTYRKFAQALTKAVESTPAHDLNMRTLALEKGLAVGVPPRYAIALALAPVEQEEDAG